MQSGRGAAAALWLALLSCSSHKGGPATPQAPTTARAVASPSSNAAPAAAAPSASATEPTLLITDPQVLAALEQRGLGLGAVLGGSSEAEDNRQLSRLPQVAPLIALLEQELAQTAAGDPLAGVDVARYSHRLFDRRFLRLAQARFALAGVVSRPDRAAFRAGSCGETRLIYRLQYRLDAERASKLPMTLGVELPAASGPDCRESARRWLEPQAASADARAEWLRGASGPLAPELVQLSKSARVVINLQIVRWPSTVRPDLGGHAEYLLRSFRPDQAGVLRPERLENTPAAEQLAAPAQRRALVTWLNENAARVDAGTPALPEAFLAQRALSVTPRGLSRLANRPFSAVLRPSDFSGHDYSTGQQIKSVPALLRRLDQLSCQGCHQARSVAGFHLLGEDAAQAPRENALAVPISAHVAAELPRRLQIARQMLAGEPLDSSAPFAERASALGQYGEHCSLGSDPSFAGWGCSTGLRCSASEAAPGEPIGQCLPAERAAGDACETGSVKPARDARRDRMGAVVVEPCAGMVCNRSSVGFPAGMCTASCDSPGASCGAIAVLDSFNACLARGESFLTCIRGNTHPAGLRSCSAEQACRDDYVCARGASGGVCLPPYFVFQLRVDGHSSSLR